MEREKITLMPLSQLRFILKLYNNPDKRGFAEGKGEGSVVKELYRKGYIFPTGRMKRRIRWTLNTEWFSESDIALMRELVKTKE